MYTPRSYRETDLSRLHEIIRRYGFATLCSASDRGLVATHLPFELDPGRGEFGTLIAHMARANPHWESFGVDSEVLVAFVGPHHYVSPSWYVEQVTVPTWNYAAVHVYGIPRIIADEDLLRQHVSRLIDTYQRGIEPEWDVRLIDGVLARELKALVGFEIPIARIEGKFKFGQNRSRADREAVMAALRASMDPQMQEVVDIMQRDISVEPAPAER